MVVVLCELLLQMSSILIACISGFQIQTERLQFLLISKTKVLKVFCFFLSLRQIIYLEKLRWVFILAYLKLKRHYKQYIKG